MRPSFRCVPYKTEQREKNVDLTLAPLVGSEKHCLTTVLFHVID